MDFQWAYGGNFFCDMARRQFFYFNTPNNKKETYEL